MSLLSLDTDSSPSWDKGKMVEEANSNKKSHRLMLEWRNSV